MDFNHQQTDHRPPSNVSYVPHQSLSGDRGCGHNCSNHFEGLDNAIEISKFIRREMEKAKLQIKEEIMETVRTHIQKERIREDIIVEEIKRRRLLEAEVRRELSIEKELASHRGDSSINDPRGFHAPLSPLEVDKRSTGQRLFTSDREAGPFVERFSPPREGKLGEGEGRPVGEKFATCLVGRAGESEGRLFRDRFGTSREGKHGVGEGRPIGEGFATSLDMRLREWEGRPLGEMFESSSEGRIGKGEAKPVGERFTTSLVGQSEGKSLVERFGTSREGRLDEGEGRLEGERFATSIDATLRESDGRPVGERFVSSREGILGEGEGGPLRDKFATSLDGRVEMPSVLLCGTGGLATGLQTSPEPLISEAKLPLGNEKQKEKIIMPTRDSLFYGGERVRYTREQFIQLREVPGIIDGILKVKVELYSKFGVDHNWIRGEVQKPSQTEACYSVRSQHKKNLFKFWCEICQIGTHTEDVMNSHRSGKNHVARKKSMLKYWCEVCQRGANTEDVIKMHLTGKKHLAKSNAVK